MSLLRLIIAALMLFALEAGAVADDPIAAAAVQPHRGVMLPLDVPLVTQSGTESTLARFFGSVPVVLVFGHYRCPNLCTTMMEGVLMAALATGLPDAGYRVIGVSIDPHENAADAQQKAAAYEAAYPQLQLQLLTGRAGAIEKLTRTAGVSYAYDATVGQYAHPLAMIIATPDGRISEYLAGVRFDAKALRLALIAASDGGIGSLAERVFLRCAHYDPKTGRYSVAVMNVIRALMLALLAAGAVWMVRRSRSG